MTLEASIQGSNVRTVLSSKNNFLQGFSHACSFQAQPFLMLLLLEAHIIETTSRSVSISTIKEYLSSDAEALDFILKSMIDCGDCLHWWHQTCLAVSMGKHTGI